MPRGQIAVKIASRMAIAGNRYNMIVRRLRDASLFSYVDSHSSSLHTGGSALSGIGAQHTEQCRCAATPEELVDVYFYLAHGQLSPSPVKRSV